MTLRSLPLAVAFVIGCAAHKQSWETMRVPEVLVEVLPRGAVLEVDEKVVGTGSRSVPLPDGDRIYRLRASAPGFEPAELKAAGKKLAGTRLGLVLRPQGFGGSRALDAGEPTGLSRAAAALLRAGRLDDARDYADRSLELGEVPLSHRVLGTVYEKKGDRRQAAQHYSIYLSLVPDAPDAPAISQAVERARGDLTIPGAGEAAPAAK